MGIATLFDDKSSVPFFHHSSLYEWEYIAPFYRVGVKYNFPGKSATSREPGINPEF
jgi:hypothetical protein